MKPEIIIYSKDYCPYCKRAKALLASKGATYTEIDLMQHPELREEMITRSGGRHTVPQIFINGQHIGGSDDLHSLDACGGLDPLLQSA